MLNDLVKSIRTKTIPKINQFEDPGLDYFIKCDLLGKEREDLGDLWKQPDLIKVLAKQHNDGSWPYPERGKSAHPTENYHILQTYRTLGFLIEMYGLDRSHPAVPKAAEFLLGKQSEEGDIRGIFGSQYAPHYTAGIMELLVKAGYDEDPRILKAFQWFEINRQEDGG